MIGGVKIANVYVGDSRKLVFPVMCDGYLKIEYDDTNANASKGNLWNHNGSFVFETISHLMMLMGLVMQQIVRKIH